MTKKSGNILVIILAIMVLISLFLAGYFFFQNQNLQKLPIVELSKPTPSPAIADETANWKTYSDNEYGFSIKYPENWYIRNRPSIILNSEPLDNTPYTHRVPGSFTISVVPFEKSRNYYSSEGKIITDTMLVDGVEVTRLKQLEFNAIGDGPLTSVVILTNKYVYYLTFDSDKFGVADPISDQILGTFRFL